MLICLLLFGMVVHDCDAVNRRRGVIQASCAMHLHKSTTVIGNVTLTSSSLPYRQEIEVHLEGDPALITEGHHGLHIHTKAVQGKDCRATGDHFNPEGREHGPLYSGGNIRHAGDLGNVRVGERGEANLIHEITINSLTEREYGSGLIEPVMRCAPEYYKVWPNGKEVRINNVKKAGKQKTRLQQQGKISFEIVKKEPDCYNPVWNIYKFTVNSPKFVLDGEDSVVGRAIVLQKQEDKYSTKDGKNDEGIACCTLTLVSEV